jgi:hypothetical protein
MSVPDADLAIRNAYESAKAVGTKGAWEAFLSAYPGGFYAKLARIQLDKLLADEAAQRAAEDAARLAREGATAPEQAKAEAQAKATADAAKKAANAAEDAAAAQPKGTTTPLKLCGEGYRRTAESSCERVGKNSPAKSAKATNNRSGFDGVWAVTWRGVSNCSSANLVETYALHIQNSVIAVSDRNYSGRVSSSGAVQWSGNATKYGGYVNYVGKLGGSSGSGRFHNTQGCRGTFTARKQ